VKTEAVVLEIYVFVAESGLTRVLIPDSMLRAITLSGVRVYLIKPQPLTELVTWSKWFCVLTAPFLI
jgi:hypothetical protein